jgi:hypothetical protein
MMNIRTLPRQAYPRVRQDVHLGYCLLVALVKVLAFMSLIAAVPFVIASDQTLLQEIGHVSLVIGQAEVVDIKGNVRVLSKDAPLFVGDVIHTDVSGHVHVRFIDDGIISLRPNTRLNIESYDYNQQEPNKSAIRFQLEKGVVRSISGKATEAAHDRFRLNTPITAIGVLGTDFLVRAEGEKMWAAVYSGAIAVSPLSQSCQSNGFGACAGAVQITPTMNNIMFEHNGQEVKAKILPQSSKEPLVTIETVAPSKVASAGQNESLDVTTNQFVNGAEKNAAAGLHSAPATVSPFVWGHWSLISMSNDTLSQSYAEARSGRDAIVFNDEFILFKDSNQANQALPTQGIYDLKLTQSLVYFVHNALTFQPPEISQANLDAASLKINFVDNQFNANFAMSIPQSISTSLSMTGTINQDGTFLVNGNTSAVAGAVSQNGDNAALMFEKSIDSGAFKGITNWVK